MSTHQFFKDHKFCYSFKNLLMLIYSKSHSKSCDYLYESISKHDPATLYTSLDYFWFLCSVCFVTEILMEVYLRSLSPPHWWGSTLQLCSTLFWHPQVLQVPLLLSKFSQSWESAPVLVKKRYSIGTCVYCC